MVGKPSGRDVACEKLPNPSNARLRCAHHPQEGPWSELQGRLAPPPRRQPNSRRPDSSKSPGARLFGVSSDVHFFEISTFSVSISFLTSASLRVDQIHVVRLLRNLHILGVNQILDIRFPRCQSDSRRPHSSKSPHSRCQSDSDIRLPRRRSDS